MPPSAEGSLSPEVNARCRTAFQKRRRTPAHAGCTLWLSVENLAVAICLAGQPCLSHLRPQNTRIQDPELNGCEVAVPHAALRACAGRLDRRGPMLYIAPWRGRERSHERGEVGWGIAHEAVVWDVGQDGFRLSLRARCICGAWLPALSDGQGSPEQHGERGD